MSERPVAEVFPPGDFIKEELEAREWTQAELADILGSTTRLVSEIVTGKRSISPKTARGLGQAFGTGAQYWMNLQTSYQLAHLESNDSVARRAKLYSKAPVTEMLRRHWIEDTDSVDVLEQRILSFFGLRTIEQELQFAAAARKSIPDESLKPAHYAWLFRARQLSQALQAKKYSASKLQRALTQLHQFLESPQDVRRVPQTLSEAGIRLVIVEHLSRTRIDGACFWLNRSAPVVALSLRFDRIDCFWHTLFHELGHIQKSDAMASKFVLDSDLVGKGAREHDDRSTTEKQADCFAASQIVPQSELSDFIARVRPLYSKKKILGFASRIGIHPGLVVGQLQFRQEISYAHSREMLVKIREHIVESALTDGWGHTPVLN